MLWQYRTLVIEFRKDGLLGEKYIDEQEVEAVLNEEGLHGWELATATMVSEGLMLFCKRELSPKQQAASTTPTDTTIQRAEQDPAPKQKTALDDIKIF